MKTNSTNTSNPASTSLPRRKRHKLPTFEVRKDGKRYYVPIPKNYRELEGGRTKFTGTKAEMEIKAEELRTKYANNPSVALHPEGVLDQFEQIKAVGFTGTLEQLLTETFAERVLLAQIKAAGYIGSSENILAEKLGDLKALKADPTFEEIIAMKIEVLKKRGKDAQVKRYQKFRLPWIGKRLAEFKDDKKASEAIVEIEAFLDKQIDFRDGEPWKETTKHGWVGLFNGVINFAINKIKTVLKENPFKKAFDYDSQKIGRNLFNLDDLQLFLTYLRHVRPELYIPFVLATWGCIRSDEVSRLAWSAIDLGTVGLKNGIIDLSAGITKMDDYREIREKDVPHLFSLLRAAKGLMGTGTGLVAVKDWHGAMTQCYRRLFGRPYPSNASRSTGASHLLIGTDMATCGRVMGHLFFGIDRTLLNFYKEHVKLPAVNRFMTMVPQPWTDEIQAKILWQMYDLKIPVTASTVVWPNYTMKCMGLANTELSRFVRNLRANRPVFATAIDSTLKIEILHRDGSREVKTYVCPNAKDAKRRQREWRLAVFTRLGTLNFDTGEVDGFEANHGPCWKQKLFRLARPQQLVEAMQDAGMNVLEVARHVQCSTDYLCAYAGYLAKKSDAERRQPKKGAYMPEKFMRRLLELFPDLTFVPVKPNSAKLAWVCRGGTPLRSKKTGATPSPDTTGEASAGAL